MPRFQCPACARGGAGRVVGVVEDVKQFSVLLTR